MGKRLTFIQKVNQKKLTPSNKNQKFEYAMTTETDPRKIRALLAAFKRRKFKKTYQEHLQYRIFDLQFPPTKSSAEVEFVNLRNAWIKSTYALGAKLSQNSIKSLKAKGYLDTMLDQVKVTSIGTRNYRKLVKIGKGNFSAEFIIYNFFDHLIGQQQRDKIIKVLERDNIKSSKMDLRNQAASLY